MSCPFYGVSLVFWPEGAQFVRTSSALSNTCALITSAHSPCWMEVGEARAPDWAECPRNPVWVVAQYAGLDDPKPDRRYSQTSFLANRIAAQRHIEANRPSNSLPAPE